MFWWGISLNLVLLLLLVKFVSGFRLELRVRHLAYIKYVRTPTFIIIVLDMRTLACMLIFFFIIFKIFQNLSGSCNFILFKNFILFFLGRDRFFIVYICCKETLFFNLSYKLLINISVCLRVFANLGCQ